MPDAPTDVVDLRSDTITRPTPAMRAVMAAAEVGDDVYGEDPEVNRLEEEVADRFGREAALFVSSGVQGNLLGMHVLGRPGTEVVVEADAHMVAFEVGSGAMFAGVQWRTVAGDQGRLNAELLRANLRPGTFPYTQVSAVCVEETTNLAGGTFAGAEALGRVRDVAHAAGLNVWMDGARMFNAVVAGGGTEREYGAAVDAFTFCVSKGLGAPVGSVVVGDQAVIDEARMWRRRHGGATRQAGILAAAARHALAHHVERLAEDHANARQLADAIAARHPAAVTPAAVATNIVYVDTGDLFAADVVARCKSQGVLVSAMASNRVRVVTHLDADAAGVARAADVLADALGEG